MMGQTPEQIIEGQRQDWNRVAGGWEKWDRFFDEQMAFFNHRLVADARLRFGMRVLDLGSGTGYPALLGAQTVGPSGSVIGLDLAEQMLLLARGQVARRSVHHHAVLADANDEQARHDAINPRSDRRGREGCATSSIA